MAVTAQMMQALHTAISAVCPIHGVSMGDENNRATWAADFAPEATEAERTAAQNVIDTVDILGPIAAEVARAASIRTDGDRIDILNRLKTATLAEMNTYVNNQIAGGTVTQLRDQTRAMFKRVLAAIMLDART